MMMKRRPTSETYIEYLQYTHDLKRYNGKEYNRELGLNWYDYGARWYDPVIGRWNAVDLLAEKYYSINSYVYVANNPMLFIDPDGRSIINPIDEQSQKVYDEYYANASPERQAELDAIDANQTVVYNVSISSKHSGGNTTPSEENPREYDVTVEDVGEYSVGILADELTHVSQIESGDLGHDEDGFLVAYDLQDEVDSKLATIEALDKKGLKMQDIQGKEEGAISAQFGVLYDNTGGNPTDKQIEKWSKTKNKAGNSYYKYFKATGGSTKMGVQTKIKTK